MPFAEFGEIHSYFFQPELKLSARNDGGAAEIPVNPLFTEY